MNDDEDAPMLVICPTPLAYALLDRNPLYNARLSSTSLLPTLLTCNILEQNSERDETFPLAEGERLLCNEIYLLGRAYTHPH